MIKQAAKGIYQHSSAFAKEMKLTREQMTTISAWKRGGWRAACQIQLTSGISWSS